MTAEQFRAWRKWAGWNQSKAAEYLGLARRTVQLYEAGEREGGKPVPIPRHVELACYALARGVREYDGPDPDNSKPSDES